MKKKKISRRKAVNIAAVSMLVAALVLGLLLRIMEIESVRIWYEGIQQLLIDFENAILAIENKHIVLLVILAIFVTKALIPFVPISTVCFITGMVFPE